MLLTKNNHSTSTLTTAYPLLPPPIHCMILTLYNEPLLTPQLTFNTAAVVTFLTTFIRPVVSIIVGTHL